MIEARWNESSIAGRKNLLEILGLNYKITNIDGRLFEFLPQLHQKWILHAASAVL